MFGGSLLSPGRSTPKGRPPCTAPRHDAALAEAEATHADDPERAEALRCARMFKASRIRAGRSAHPREAQRALEGVGLRIVRSLRQERASPSAGDDRQADRVVLVLAATRTGGTHARRALREPVPSYQAVDFLRRAEESDGAPRDTVAEIRKRVLDEAAPAASVTRAYKDVVFPIDEATRRERDMAGVKNVAKRLRELLEETRAVPRKLAGEVAGALDKLLEAIEDKEEAA